MEIPKFLEHLPVFGGFPVPFTVTWINGKPDFRIPDAEKIANCIAYRLCNICGRKLGEYSFLIGGPITAETRLFTDPPMHEKCAQFSMATCPFLTGKRTGYSDRAVDAPHHTVIDQGVMPTRPEVMYIFKVITKKVEVTDEGYITTRFIGKREYRTKAE